MAHDVNRIAEDLFNAVEQTLADTLDWWREQIRSTD